MGCVVILCNKVRADGVAIAGKSDFRASGNQVREVTD